MACRPKPWRSGVIPDPCRGVVVEHEAGPIRDLIFCICLFTSPLEKGGLRGICFVIPERFNRESSTHSVHTLIFSESDARHCERSARHGEA